LKPDLSVNVAGIKMKNPVGVASGTFGYGVEYAELLDLSQLGFITVKGIRKEPCEGNPTPRIWEVPGGMLNAIGLQGPGTEGFIEDYMPFLRTVDVPVIVNIWGTTLNGYVQTAEDLSDVDGIAALEINVSCPNVKEGGSSFGASPKSVFEVVSAVRKTTKLPLITKLAPNVPDIRVFAKAAEEAGSDALAVSNTLPGMAFDIEERRPVLANKTGGLSGSALHPVAVKLVWDAASAVNIPIIGMGGIFEPADAIEFLVAGASAVAVGTANFIDPSTSLRVIDGIEDYMKRHDMDTVSQIAV
jgi:dihydroorotate dehydrogenase (NAD+) catalytic subunit